MTFAFILSFARIAYAPYHRKTCHMLDIISGLYQQFLESPAFVIGQLGQSLDGRIATPTGHSKYISGPEALRHLHQLRALVDAVVVGVQTVIADDPQLTV